MSERITTPEVFYLKLKIKYFYKYFLKYNVFSLMALARDEITGDQGIG
jgi:hypothetical protein